MKVSTESDREIVIQKIKAIKLDKPWEISADVYKPSKTDPQRAWFHILCRQLGQEVGMTEGDVKDMVKAKMFGTKAVIKWGMTIVVPDAPHTEPLSKRVYSELIELVYMLGGEAGVVLPNPKQF